MSDLRVRKQQKTQTAPAGSTIIISLVAPDYNQQDRAFVQEAAIHIADGEEYVAKLEARLAAMFSAAGAVCTTSGTAGLQLALMGLEIECGDIITLPTYSCVALAHACGVASPSCPILFEDCIYSPATMEYNLHGYSQGHIRPHMFGVQCEWDERACVIEDWAMALGSQPWTINGDCAVLSFHESKMVSGQHGGAVVTNDPNLLARLRGINDYADACVADRFNDKPEYVQRVNYRMSGLNAALVLSQLDRLPQFVERRRQIADYYNDALRNCAAILPTRVPEGSVFGRYVFALQKMHPIEALRRLSERGIEGGRGCFPTLDMYLGLPASDFPNAHKAVETCLSLPCYPALTDAEVECVAESARCVLS